MDFDAVWRCSFGQINLAIQKNNYLAFLDLLAQNDNSLNSPDNRGYLPIHHACLTMNPYKYLIELLKYDVVNVNSVTYDGSTPLILICKNSFYSFSSEHLINSAKLLIEKGSDINWTNDDLEFPLLLSAERGMFEIVKYLCSRPEIEIDKKNIYGRTAIDKTLFSQQNESCFEHLLNSGANIDDMTIDMKSENTLLTNTINFENFKTFQRLINVANERGIKNYVNIRLKDGTTPLMIACQKNLIKFVRFLLDNEADVNAITTDQVTVLHFVAQFCDLDILELILQNFNFSILPNFIDTNDKRIFNIKNPLHLAITFENENIVKYFLDRDIFSSNSLQIIGVNNEMIHCVFDDRNIFYSALAYSLSINASKSIISCLIQSGGSLDQYSEIVLSPIQCVFSTSNAKKDYYHIFNYLLKIGCDINKFARFKCKNYVSNLSLLVYYPKLLRKFISYGLDIDDLFSIEPHYPVKSTLICKLLEIFMFVPRTKNVFKFWIRLKSKIHTENINNEDITKIDQLFKTPNSLTQLSKHQFRKRIWQKNQNTVKFRENIEMYLPIMIE